MSYTDSSVQPNTQYSYSVAAVNSAGSSAASNIATAVTPATVPSAPSNLGVTVPSATWIQLTWTDNSTNETGFMIERQTWSGSWALLTTTAAGVTSYTDTTVLASTQYSYRVSAANSAGTSSVSNVATGTTPTTVPDAPSNLALTVQSATSIQLTWTDNSSNETGFRIERQMGGGSWALLTTTAAGATTTMSYTDTTVLAGTQYAYRVSAANSAGNSSVTNVATGTTPATTTTVPMAPSNLTGTAVSANQINLAWTDNSSNESGFVIQRMAAGDTSWSLVTTTAPNFTALTDSTAMPGTQYTYRVLAFNEAGYSAESNAAGVMTPAPPTAPSNLVLTVQSSTAIQLGWTDNATNETGFRIERQTGSGSWTFLTTTAANVTGYTDTTVAAATPYAYRVKAINSVGSSAPSNVATASTLVVLPAAPSNLVLTVQSSNALGLAWTAHSTNETGFKIERQDGGSGTWTVVTTTGPGVASYSDTTVAANTLYAYRVSAVNAAGTSATTNIASGTTPSAVLVTPGTGWTGPTATPATMGQAGQTGYTATAIARWDVVPYQTFAGSINVGVVAFDVAGIDHVAFSVNGGPWSNVSAMTLNPQTGVVEYWATLRAADLADGPVEVRAIAYPTAGVPRVLGGANLDSGHDSLVLYANAHGTLNTAPIYVSPTGSDSSGDGTPAHPYRSMLQASLMAPPGATVYLQAGRYTMDERYTGFRDSGGRWLTFTTAPGVAQSDVTIVVQNTDMRASKTRFQNVLLDFTMGVVLNAGGVWLDHVDAFGSLTEQYTGMLLTFIQSGDAGPIYVTDSKIHDMQCTPLMGPTLARNIEVYNIYGHGVNDPGLLLNSTIHDVTAGNDPTGHIDGLFWYSPNVDVDDIVYGLTMTNIGGLSIFSDNGLSNLAIVNLTSTAIGDCVGGACQFGKGIGTNIFDHLVFDNVHLTNQKFYFIDDSANNVWSNSILRNSSADLVFSVNPANMLFNDILNSGVTVPNK
jgi:fibronectin type 3 domain-containing protein